MNESEKEDLIRRMKIVLAHRDGLNKSEIARKLDTSRNTVAKWISRFEEDGVGGLFSIKSPGRPPEIDPAIRAELVRLPSETRPPIDLGDQWSVRLLAVAFGISEGAVASAWREAGFDPPQHLQQVETNPDRWVPFSVEFEVPAWLKLHLELLCRGKDRIIEEHVLDCLTGWDELRDLRGDILPTLKKRWTDQNEKLPRVDPRRLEYRAGLDRRSTNES